MKAYGALPKGYSEKYTIDLKADKKAAMRVNILAIVIAVVMIAVMAFIVPATGLFDTDSLGQYCLRWGVCLAAMLAYLVLHELTHGAAMKLVGGRKVKYGIALPYAYAGSDEDFFDKGAYRLIALAPVVLWGVIFAILMFVLPTSWFWFMWILQVVNVSGAAGDLYVTWCLWGERDSILVMDTGTHMTVYDK